jgi:hypothetical protein
VPEPLDASPVGIADVRAVVTGVVVRAEAWRTVVLAAGADRGRVEGVDRVAVGRGEGNVDSGRRLSNSSSKSISSGARAAR